jgi:hypothetical protein
MTNISQLEPAMKAANDAWGFNPLQKVRMPMLENQRVITEEVDALWTDGGLRPNANNLAFLMQSISGEGDVEQWTKRLTTFPVRGSLLISPNSFYFLQSNSDTPNELETHQLNIDTWREMLVSPKSHLFKPRELAKLKSGQLSLADIEDTNLEGSFNFLLREQQKKIEQAFLQGIKEALKFVDNPVDSGSSRSEIKGHVIRFAIAYLAARILEDKNFFNARIEDPIELLERIGKIRNGFFKRAIKSAKAVGLSEARKAIVHHMGYQVSFVLADHRDVGRLYEQAIKSLKEQHKDLDDENWGDLKQHYTPVAIAERMLEALPLERLRPSERVIFDPAAGSGSLLLAATSRLAGMTDITPEERNSYLRTNVIGNDLDPYASWIAQLRYFLASESLGSANEPCQISEVLPFPDSFTQFNYNDIELDTLPVKPRVIVANPPFKRTGKIEEAVDFVRKALTWMENGSQFAFVLPQLFLTGQDQVKDARDLMNQQCQILETWQFPENVVGTNARQSTCIVIGIKGKPKNDMFTLSRAIISGSQLDKVTENGFLGQTWACKLNLSEDWSSAKYPSVNLVIPTIPIGKLFYIFRGAELDPDYKPISKPINGIKCKRYWSLQWRGKDRLWANPNNVPNDKKWIRFGSKYLKSLPNEKLVDLPKLLVGRRGNSNNKEPLAARLDTSGLCPNTDVFCILPIGQAQKHNPRFTADETPENWNSLTFDDQKLWLLGLLASDLLVNLSMPKRDSRGISIEALLQLPLPTYVDNRIIEVTKRIIERDKNDELIPEHDNLRAYLNELVKNSYGNPKWTSIQRTGISPELEAWKLEQEIKKTKTAIGQVLEISEDKSQVLMYISRLMDDDDTEGEWIPLPQELPGWALDGTPFEVQLSHDVKTFAQLRERPWALRRFQHEPRTYLTDDELEEFLRMPELEVLS